MPFKKKQEHLCEENRSQDMAIFVQFFGLCDRWRHSATDSTTAEVCLCCRISKLFVVLLYAPMCLQLD